MDLQVVVSSAKAPAAPPSARAPQSHDRVAADGPDRSFADTLAAIGSAIDGKDQQDETPERSTAPTCPPVTSLQDAAQPGFAPGWAVISPELTTVAGTGDSDASPADPASANSARAGDQSDLTGALDASGATAAIASPAVSVLAQQASAFSATSATSTLNADSPAGSASDPDAGVADALGQPSEQGNVARAFGLTRRAERRAAGSDRQSVAAPADQQQFDATGVVETARSQARGIAPSEQQTAQATDIADDLAPVSAGRGVTKIDKAVPAPGTGTAAIPASPALDGRAAREFGGRSSSDGGRGAGELAAALAQQNAANREPSTITTDLLRAVHATAFTTPGTLASAIATSGSHELSNSLVSGTALPAETTTQIVQALRLQVTQGGGTAHIRLDPQHLGELTVTITVDRGQVVARLEAEAPAVREWLQTNQGWLRANLAEQNLTLGRLEVAEPRESENGKRQPGDPSRGPREDQSRRRRPQPETGERFEVIA